MGRFRRKHRGKVEEKEVKKKPGKKEETKKERSASDWIYF